MQNLKEEKRLARENCKKARSLIPSEKRAEYSRLICDAFISYEGYVGAEVLLAYYPIGSEADILPIIEHALSSGKHTALPVCSDSSDDMEFYFIDSINELKAGRFSIPSPSDLSKKYLPQSDKRRAIMAVPALALDKSGKRLGYGRGFYDRYIPRFHGELAGFSYSSLLFDSLPSEPHDAAVDIIVTEKGVISI